MNTRHLRRVAVAVSAGDSDTSSDAGADKAASSAPAKATESAATMDEPFGPGCASVPKEGAGSFKGMAQDPVATAASNNPALSTLVAAVKQADLDKLLANKAELTKVLTAHVVGEKLTPMQLEKGSFDTLAKTKLTTAGSGEEYTVNDSSKVVCGNVPTANATVYIVDTVLMPAA